MNRAAKIFCSLISIFIIALCACMGLSACSSKYGGDSGGVENSDVVIAGMWDEYEGVRLAFVDEESYNEGNVDEGKVLPELNCKLGNKYYMVADFDIQASQDNDGRETVIADVIIQPTTVVKATIQDTNTGTVSEETNGGITSISATYKIPEKADSVRNMRLVIKFEPQKSGLALIDLTFKSSGNIQGVKTSKIEKSAVMGYTEKLTYALVDDVYVATGASDTARQIIIPNMYNGKYVRGIGEEAFKGLEAVESIIIPDSVNDIGNMAFNECDSLESIIVDGRNAKYKSEENCLLSKDGKNLITGCKNSVVPNGVVNIGEFAFSGCTGLKSINIPESVTNIEDGAFKNCCGLADITVDDGNVQYKSENNCLLNKSGTALVLGCKNSVIPHSVNRINSYAFYGCTGIESFTIPDGVREIGGYAFRGCNITNIVMPVAVIDYVDKSNLETVVLTGSESINEFAFDNCSGLKSVTISEGISGIDKSAFRGCSGLTDVTIPESITSIGERAFYGCSALTNVKISNNVTDIGWYAFYDCPIEYAAMPAFASAYIDKSNLETVVITGGESIGEEAFNGCSTLKSITIANSVKIIGKRAFNSCRRITSIAIPDGVTEIGDSAFGSCSKLTSIVLPDSLKIIGGWAFSYCGELASIALPDSVTSLGSYAFYECRVLTSVTLSKNLTYIDENAFSFCEGLTSISLPNGITELRHGAFIGCDKLKSINIPNSVTVIGGWVFRGCYQLKTFVFDGDEAEWNAIEKGGGWSNGLRYDYKVQCNDGVIESY